MHVDTGSFQALQGEVAELAEQVRQLRRDAFTIKTLEEMMLEEMMLERSGYIPPPDGHAGRTRHLRPLDGGQS